MTKLKCVIAAIGCIALLHMIGTAQPSPVCDDIEVPTVYQSESCQSTWTDVLVYRYNGKGCQHLIGGGGAPVVDKHCCQVAFAELQAFPYLATWNDVTEECDYVFQASEDTQPLLVGWATTTRPCAVQYNYNP